MESEERSKGRGFTLPGLLISLVLLGGVSMVGLAVSRSHSATRALDGATRVARGALDTGRLTAVARRRVVRLRLEGARRLVLYDDGDHELRGWPLGREGPFRLDSIRLRPRTLRFNSRGQAAPGSVYLYRGGGGRRLVINFLGRVRVERFAVP